MYQVFHFPLNTANRTFTNHVPLGKLCCHTTVGSVLREVKYWAGLYLTSYPPGLSKYFNVKTGRLGQSGDEIGRGWISLPIRPCNRFNGTRCTVAMVPQISFSGTVMTSQLQLSIYACREEICATGDPSSSVTLFTDCTSFTDPVSTQYNIPDDSGPCLPNYPK